MQATLSLVRRSHDHLVYVIQAPAVAGVLTRTANGLSANPESGLTRMGFGDLPEATADRFADAFAGKPVAGFDFLRHKDGKWYVKVLLQKPAKPSPNRTASRVATKACAHQTREMVDTMDTNTMGTHSCPQCHGTGRYVTGIENDAPKFGTGICYRCKGKGHTTEIDRRRNLKYWEYAAAKAMGADIANAKNAAS